MGGYGSRSRLVIHFYSSCHSDQGTVRTEEGKIGVNIDDGDRLDHAISGLAIRLHIFKIIIVYHRDKS